VERPAKVSVDANRLAIAPLHAVTVTPVPTTPVLLAKTEMDANSCLSLVMITTSVLMTAVTLHLDANSCLTPVMTTTNAPTILVTQSLVADSPRSPVLTLTLALLILVILKFWADVYSLM